jgi:hypothetical protein
VTLREAIGYWWVLVLAGVLIIVGSYIFCGGSNGPSPTEANLQSNVDQGKGAAKVIVNQVTNQQQEVNGAAKQTNEGIGNFHSSVNRDSSTFNGNGTDRFCERFPNDSTCDEWRRQHNR